MTEQKPIIINYNQKQAYKEGIYLIIGIQSIENSFRVSHFTKKKYYVECKNGEFIYSKDGGLLRKEKIKKNSYIITTFDQLSSLKWGIEYEKQNMAKWCPIWDQKKLNAGGYIKDDDCKIGKWIDLSENFSNISKVTHEGVYEDGIKIGRWVTIYSEKIIGEGIYNSKGMKKGKWVEIYQRFSDCCQITFHGEYREGKKFGLWEILHTTPKKKQIIGGGFYGFEEQKVGRWIEQHENFTNFIDSNQYNCQLLQRGNYQYGKKIGRWDILFSKDPISLQKFEIIGGGIYDENAQQQGIWFELSENFGKYSQIRSLGEYWNGKKYGRWNTQFRDYQATDFIKMVDGEYDNEGNQKGKWIELFENYRNDIQIIYTGEYKNGIKYGLWDMKKRNYFNKQFIYFAGGVYILGQKNGKWIEIDQDSYQKTFLNYTHCQVVQYKDGIKSQQITCIQVI
ncbi:unnamed protein product [Paramecium sonneborni]|uniref:Uncharacterized protein n=1 Tax=Paramecium sonneborni TaxID=65129 RepID=A0A8S1NF53_9CILI|nr:unnamed protein product [Paramecium sonneborni]